jgi:hypothetical protein
MHGPEVHASHLVQSKLQASRGNSCDEFDRKSGIRRRNVMHARIWRGHVQPAGKVSAPLAGSAARAMANALRRY